MPCGSIISALITDWEGLERSHVNSKLLPTKVDAESSAIYEKESYDKGIQQMHTTPADGCKHPPAQQQRSVHGCLAVTCVRASCSLFLLLKASLYCIAQLCASDDIHLPWWRPV
jgi:hypothetical protein